MPDAKLSQKLLRRPMPQFGIHLEIREIYSKKKRLDREKICSGSTIMESMFSAWIIYILCCSRYLSSWNISNIQIFLHDFLRHQKEVIQVSNYMGEFWNPFWNRLEVIEDLDQSSENRSLFGGALFEDNHRDPINSGDILASTSWDWISDELFWKGS